MTARTMPQLTLSQWKREHGARVHKALQPKGGGHEEPLISAETHNLTPMFVPTRTDGNDFFEISTRKEFLDREINGWLKWHSYRGMAVIFGIATLFLFTIHPLLGAMGGLATGWAFGWYHRQSRSIDILKKRDLFEAV